MTTKGRWLLDRVQQEAMMSSVVVSSCVEVREILEEAIDDVEEAFRMNQAMRNEQELELARYEAEVARNELGVLREKYVALARVRRDRDAQGRELRNEVAVSLSGMMRREKHFSTMEGKQEQLEMEASRVPGLEREILRCRREIEALKRREDEQNDQPAKVPEILTDNRLLLKIFSFLTTWNVLATAQTNRALYTRVDALFGIGSGVRPKPRPKPRSSLNAQTAAVIASKLTASEIKSIIALDENARKLEAECSLLRAEKEDLQAALSSAESVKDFLATKLTQVQAEVEDAKATSAEIARQQKSDQEVILFLDTRNRQLESDAHVANLRTRQLKQSLGQERDHVKAQLAGLQQAYDQLQTQSNESDKTHKKQRALLVKEVRALRAQLAAVRRAAK